MKLIAIFFLALLVFALPAFAANPTPRIFNGERAQPQDWPSIAFVSSAKLKENRKSSTSLFCSASLIDPRWVITAAHCLHDQDNKVIRAVFQRYEMSNSNQGFEIKVRLDEPSSFFIHPDWIGDKFINNDVALIKLPRPAENVEPLPIAAKNPPPGSLVKIAGYGMTDLPYTSYLKEVRAKTKKLSNCRHDYYDLDQSMICVTQINGDTCPGDSGGPLVYKGALLGITSFGVRGGCGDSKLNWFANVPAHYHWIKNVVGSGRSPLSLSNIKVSRYYGFWRKDGFYRLSFNVNQPVQKTSISFSKKICYYKTPTNKSCFKKGMKTILNKRTNVLKTQVFKLSPGQCLFGKVIVDQFSGDPVSKKFKACLKS